MYLQWSVWKELQKKSSTKPNKNVWAKNDLIDQNVKKFAPRLSFKLYQPQKLKIVYVSFDIC